MTTRDPWTPTYTARAEILADGRKRIHLTCESEFPCWNRTTIYTTVRNIDGSNRFMQDDAYWTFLPLEIPEIREAVTTALSALPQAA